MSFKIKIQHDSMQCGIACLQMICEHYGRTYSSEMLSQRCFATNEGVSLLGMSEAANTLGLHTICAKVPLDSLAETHLPCILHWNQNHFVVLYKVKKGCTFYVADPGKGLIKYGRNEFASHWVSMPQEEKGIAMFLETTPEFYALHIDDNSQENHSFRFLMRYVRNYRKSFLLVILTLIAGGLLQLLLPFLTQSIVDVGIRNRDIGFVWLILSGQLMLTASRTAIDFGRRWLLLRISMNINIALISDFFIKLLKLPMSFFETKLMGDLMQRMNDHHRVNTFLTQQALNMALSAFTFLAFSIVLFCYSRLVFAIFLAGSTLYAAWMTLFLKRRKVIDYEYFDQQAINNNKTYEFVTSMQEIKLQDCEQRRRNEWEHTQRKLLDIEMKSLKLQQTQEAGSICINEIKNMVIWMLAVVGRS